MVEKPDDLRDAAGVLAGWGAVLTAVTEWDDSCLLRKIKRDGVG